MDQADGVIERVAEHRQARMLGLAEQFEQFGQSDTFVYRNDFGARHHHVGNPQFAETQQIAHQHALLGRKVGRFPLAFLDHLFQAFADCGRLRILAGDLSDQALYGMLAHCTPLGTEVAA